MPSSVVEGFLTTPEFNYEVPSLPADIQKKGRTGTECVLNQRPPAPSYEMQWSGIWRATVCWVCGSRADCKPGSVAVRSPRLF